MNVLLTGASGFLGRNLILGAPVDWRILAVYYNDLSFPDFVAQAANPKVRAIRCNLASQEETSALFRDYGRDWDCCLHLAAKVDIPWSVREPAQDLIVNVGPLINLLADLRAERFVYFSSGAVYDGLQGEARPDAPLAPTLPYAISKLAAERYVHFYAERKRSLEKYLIVRFFGAYGPYEAPHKIYTRLIRAFAVDRSDTYTIYGDGTNLVDAMYVDDAIDAVRRMCTGDRWNATVNLAGGRPITIEELVRKSAAVFGLKSVSIRKEGVANESNQFWGSTREMRDALSFEATVDLATGMNRFRNFLMNTASQELPDG